MADVVKYIITVHAAEDRSRCFTGGDYDFGVTEYRDLWTGELIVATHWTSADFDYCPLYGGFGCACEEHGRHGHTDLWEEVDAHTVHGTVYVYEGEEETDKY